MHFLGNARLDDHVVGLARTETANYSGEFAAYLRSPSDQALALFNQKIQSIIGQDRLVVVEFYDATSKKIAEVVKPSAKEVEASLPRHGSSFASKNEVVTKKLSLGRDTYIRVFVPILDSSKVKIGYLEGVYLAPAEVVTEIKRQTFWSLGLVVLVIFVTTIVLYPLIIRLNRRLFEYSQLLAQTNIGMLKVLGSAIAKRDSDTNIHNYRVTL